MPTASNDIAHRPKHLLGIDGLQPYEIDDLLERADGFVGLNRQADKKLQLLRGLTQINLFFESSTRTHTCFELAGKRLGADVVNMSVASSAMKKGETLIDTAMTLNAMHPDVLVVRHQDSGAVALLARHVRCAVINAGDGTHEHPTQALLDALTIRRRKGRIDGLTVAICGDILHSRVARSNILLLTAMGARVRVVAPPTLLPAGIDGFGVEVHTDMQRGLEDVDIVMMLRLQTERMQGSFVPSVREYFHFYGLTYEKLRAAKPDALIMHPGPMNRGVEIDGVVADDIDRSAILDQVEMGVAVRMAVLDVLTRDLRPAAHDPPGRPGQRAAARSRDWAGSARRAARGRRAHCRGRPERHGGLAPGGAEVIDARGLCLAPGLVDMRVQLGEPGAEHKERIDSGAAAAAAGGVTSMAVLPNTDPPIDDPAMVEFVARRARQVKLGKVYPYAAITKGLAGQELAEIGLLKAAGAVAFTDGERALANARVMRRALSYAAGFDALIVQHPEEPTLAERGMMNEGPLATRLGLAGISPAAEMIMVERDLRLVELTGGRLHVAHVSTAGAIAAIRSRQGARPEGHLRHRPALSRAERARGRGLPHLRQGVAAAALRRRPARRRRRAQGRDHRRHRQRPLPAGPGQQAPALRPGGVRRHRRPDHAAGVPAAGPRGRDGPAAAPARHDRGPGADPGAGRRPAGQGRARGPRAVRSGHALEDHRGHSEEPVEEHRLRGPAGRGPDCAYVRRRAHGLSAGDVISATGGGAC